MSFDWQTEDKAGWDDPVSPPPDKPPQWRRWWWAVAGVVLLLLVTAVLTRALQQRLESVTGELEAEVLASYTVIEAAAVRGDGEVVASFLSGRDNAWATAVTQMAANGGVYQRDGLGLTWLENQPPASPTMTFAPDLQSAEVSKAVAYAIDVGNGVTETVVLTQTAVYRSGDNRWLLAPPDADFWGDSRTVSGQYLSVQYPTRDADLARRLFLNLDDKLGQMCSQLPNFSCPNDFAVSLMLSTEPGTLAGANLPAVLANSPAALTLPTPTLVGIPQTESGYQALFRGYASLVLASAITDIVEWRCCEQAVFYQAVLSELLRQLSLQPETLTAVQFDVLWQSNASLTEGAHLWALTEAADSWLAVAIVAMAQDVWGQTAVSLIYSLADDPPPNFGDWLHELAGPDRTNEELLATWAAYVNGRLSQPGT